MGERIGVPELRQSGSGPGHRGRANGLAVPLGSVPPLAPS
jgi:hypothetical protein